VSDVQSSGSTHEYRNERRDSHSSGVHTSACEVGFGSMRLQALLSGPAFVPVMQPTDLGECNHLAHGRRLNGPMNR
jgi:hypothetical protein